MGWCLENQNGKNIFSDMLIAREIVDIYSESTARDNNWGKFLSEAGKHNSKSKHHAAIQTPISVALHRNNECAHHLYVGCFVSSLHDEWSIRGIKSCNLYKLVTILDSCRGYFDDCYKYKYFGERPCLAFINLKTKSICVMSVSSRKKHFSENYFSVVAKPEEQIAENFSLLDDSQSLAIIGETLKALADEWNKFVFEDGSSRQWKIIERKEKMLQIIFKNFSTDYLAE